MDQIGYDTSFRFIQRAINGLPVYEIDVFGQTDQTGNLGVVARYRTVKNLQSFAADTTVGRATRVFLIVDTSDKTADPETFVLKDVWTHSDRDREHLIMEKILEDATPEEKEHFLTVLHGGDVMIETPGDASVKLDHTGNSGHFSASHFQHEGNVSSPLKDYREPGAPTRKVLIEHYRHVVSPSGIDSITASFFASLVPLSIASRLFRTFSSLFTGVSKVRST